jgi:hypothetical protein
MRTTLTPAMRVRVSDSSGAWVYTLSPSHTTNDGHFVVSTYDLADTPDASFGVDNDTPGTGAGAGPDTGDASFNMTLGAQTGGSDFWVGSVAEICFFDTSLTAGERILLKRYFSDKFGIV